MGNLQQRAVLLTPTSQGWCMKTCLEHLRRGQVPGTPGSIPLQSAIGARGHAAASDYYPRTLSLTSVAGLGRLPQVSLPLAQSGGVPVGLSLLAANGRDAFLLGVVGRV